MTGGITLDATGAETYGTVVALAESPITPGCCIAGTDDGNVWMTQNDGATWENRSRCRASRRIAAGDIYVARIEPSHFDDAHVLRHVRQSSLERLHAVPLRDDRLAARRSSRS